VSERSVNFDRAAEYYDRTRVTDPEALAETLDLLERELAGRGRILEIGVGTGALAVPLAGRGQDLVGVDVSTAMLAQLRTKAATIPIVAADARALPFRDDTFGAAYARWVLHLIPDWRDVVGELARVVGPGGVVLIEPGGYQGTWLEVWLQIRARLGSAVAPVGLDAHEQGSGDLDDVFAGHGASARTLPAVRAATTATLGRFFPEARERLFSWTWRVDEGRLHAALDEVESWARQRFGDDLDAIAADVEMAWRAYDLP
jgi:SAM-dependent methyltransferase